jgi:magnesium transporter
MHVQVMLFSPDGAVRSGGRELIAAAGAGAPEGAAEGGFAWVDLEGQAADTERLLLEMGFHPLAVEDTLTLEHQPKIEEYPGCLFVIVRGLDFNRAGTRLTTLKLAAFLDGRRLVTYHRAPMRSVAGVRQRLADGQRAPQGGPVHLFYSICDQVIDHYFPVLDKVAEEVEKTEEEIFQGPTQSHLQRLLELRRRLATLRRVMLPHRQVFNHLANAKTPYVDDATALYFRDIYDNVLRLADAIDQQRDLLASTKDTYLSVLGQRTNEVMKVLTLFAAILLPLSLIAGIYGMNFEHMPELHTRWGYFGALGLMAAVAAALAWWFRRRGWF